MKITRLEIKDYQQFKDFTLELTYPKGHELEGQPLKKVCFIGQSGTGKTTILNVISDLIEGQRAGTTRFDESFYNKEIIYKISYHFLDSKSTGSSAKNIISTLKDGYIDYDYVSEYNFDWTEERFNLLYFKKCLKNLALFLGTGLENHVNSILGTVSMEKPLIHTQADDKLILEKIQNAIYQFITKSVIRSKQDFDNEGFRLFLLKELDEYDRLLKERFTNFLSKAFNSNADKVLEEMKQWKIDNPNPRIKIGKKLKPIFEKFNLKIDEEWADGGLKLKTLQDQEVPVQAASTGTKQILLSVIPLALMETAHRVILIDEPENSLFPDIQRTLINYYTQLAPEAQFFFATHSPLIASQFEPCERFILSFDENGNVQAKNGIAPQGDDPNDLLTKDFGLRNLLGEKGLEAFERFVALKMMIRNEKNQEKGDALMNEYLKLQREYNF